MLEFGISVNLSQNRLGPLDDKKLPGETRRLRCAGLNRHEAEDESSLRERSSDLLGLESCARYREVHSEA
jgi:hypothetical protein